MAVIKKCDVCNIPYEPYGTRKDLARPNGFTYLNIGNCGCGGRPPYYVHKLTDCCPECMERIKTFIDSLIEEANTPPEEEKPDIPVDPEEPPAQPEGGEEGAN